MGVESIRGSSPSFKAALGGALLVVVVCAEVEAASVRSPIVSLGRRIFFDESLSASGRLSCASCHSPEHAYGPPNGRAVQLGGAALDREGLRAVSSLRYVLNRTPVWRQVYVANPAERILEGNEPPAGGFGWDGRFNTLREQARFPLLADNEMANLDETDVARKLARASYAGELKRLFGRRIFEHPSAVVDAALAAVERFELDDRSFHPYTSKYDEVLDGRARLSAAELRGLGLFNDPQRGNCASCHVSALGADRSHPLFTDYQFQALGVPRNGELQANASAEFFDEGLCGPLRADQKDQAPYCGRFKAPSLRNVATRGVFFHNGKFHTLKDALQFYVRRDSDAARWYPVDATGTVNRYNDLPEPLRSNVDVIDRPLTRHAGGDPVWSDTDIDDVIAFLATLTDRDVKPIQRNRMMGQSVK